MTIYKDYGWSEGETDAHGYLYPALREMLSHDKGKRILDLGCGNGFIAGRLLNDGYDVYGLDASASGVDIANRRYPGRFFVQDISTEILPAGLAHLEFDLIISTEVIEHLYAPRAYMKLIQNVLGLRGGV